MWTMGKHVYRLKAKGCGSIQCLDAGFGIKGTEHPLSIFLKCDTV